ISRGPPQPHADWCEILESEPSDSASLTRGCGAAKQSGDERGSIMQTVKQILLARRPEGVPVPEDFELAEAPMPVPGEGEFLVAMRVGSVDPAIRGFLDDRPSYLPPVALGAPIAGMSLGEVVQSNSAKYPVGTLVRALG